MAYITENRPEDWPVNAREYKLDCIWETLDKFEDHPSYKTREVLLSLVSDNDLNQHSSIGKFRFTEYEVELINLIYWRALRGQINAVKVYLYDLITEATWLQKMYSLVNPIVGERKEAGYSIEVYENGLPLPLKLYHFAYQKYIVEKTKSFAEQLLGVVEEIYSACSSEEDINTISYAYSAMLNDISYMRGSKTEQIWQFNREELLKILKLEAELLSKNNQNPTISPTRGVLMTQISNFILKSRHNYNQDYICKYVSKEVAMSSVENLEIWMRKTENLNDKREQRVVPELFEDESWIGYEWAKNIDFTPCRTYYVSSFSKSINANNMKDGYGECLYGYKNDRIVDLIGPLHMQTFVKRDGCDDDLPDKKDLPAISQVIAFDVLYDIDEAKEELKYLFEIVDAFDINDDEKHLFLQEILQYWILSVKDSSWSDERERRYVLFLYEGYNYLETVVEDGFLKEKSSLFMLPDFIMGENPVRNIVKMQLEEKQKATMSKEYLHCLDCLVQDYDFITNVNQKECKCPVCGSQNVTVVYGNDCKKKVSAK